MSSVDPDKIEPTVIRGAKISFEPVRGYPADAQTLSRYAMSTRIAADIYQRWIDDNFDIRVISVCGYNPQKLLPAPSFEREFLQSVAEWAAEQIKMPYTEFAQSVFNTLTRDGEVTYHAGGSVSMADATWQGPGRGFEPYQKAAMEALVGVPDKGIKDRFNEIAKTAGMEMRVIFFNEEELRVSTPRGRIEIFDYDDGTVINLEGEGELPGRPDIVDDLFSGEFARRMSESFARTKLEQRPAPRKNYLDHDPTKQHKRRKKK